MSENISKLPPSGPSPESEGGLRPPPGLSFWRRVWWWFHFLILVKLARLRFIAILLAIGLVIVYWETLVAYYERWTRPDGAEQAAASDIEFFCPMHPTVIRDHAREKCPICFMPLAKRKKGDATPLALPAGIVNRVQLTPYRIVLAGIQTWKVAHVALHKEISTVGFIEFNERELKHVAARVKARIEKLYINETGQWVDAGDELALLYSPDLAITLQNVLDQRLEESARDRLRLWGIDSREVDRAVAMQKFIDAVRGGDKARIDEARKHLHKLEHGEKLAAALIDLLEGQRMKNSEKISDARHRLIELRVHEDQVEDVLETGKVIRRLIIRAPIQGHVIKKYVKEGQYVEEGSPLYDVVDLATVWIQAQVYEEDMPFLPAYHRPARTVAEKKRGLRVTATTRAFPGETFKGHLTFIYPHVDQDTRTVTARFELPNPGHKLRPGTSATVKINVPPLGIEAIGTALAADLWTQTAVDGLGGIFSGGAALPGVGLGPLTQSAVEHTLWHNHLVLAVPESAVIDTGNERIVYREIVPGEYEGVLVDLGPRLLGAEGVFYPVLRGLSAGDRIVTAGSFLLDAETRLNPAAGSIYFGGSGSRGVQSSITSVRPSTPADIDAKIKQGLAKLSESDRRLAQAQIFCPVLGESGRLGSMGTPIKLRIDDKPVFVCCADCVKKAEEARPADLFKKIEDLKTRAQSLARRPPLSAEEEAEIKAAMAQLKPDDRRLAEAQKICPVSEEPLGSMGVPVKLNIKGQPVFICCASCERQIPNREAEILKKVNAYRARFGAKK